MDVGYARISTAEQSLDLQIDALTKAGCKQIFHDTISGGVDERPELAKVTAFLRPGDCLVVWRLDRLGRSVSHLVNYVRDLERRGIGFRSLTEAIDTSSPGGRLVFVVFAALAEFERDLIRARTRAGLAAARERGRVGGRPQSMDKEALELAARLMGDAGWRASQVSDRLGVSRSTLYRHMKNLKSPAATPAPGAAGKAPEHFGKEP